MAGDGDAGASGVRARGCDFGQSRQRLSGGEEAVVALDGVDRVDGFKSRVAVIAVRGAAGMTELPSPVRH